MNETMLGKITRASIGKGGYDDAMLGLSLSFSGKGWGCSCFLGTWSCERSEHSKWTEEDRTKKFAEVMWKVNELLKEADVDSVTDLVNIPVEVVFEKSEIKTWRILTEVL